MIRKSWAGVVSGMRRNRVGGMRQKVQGEGDAREAFSGDSRNAMTLADATESGATVTVVGQEKGISHGRRLTTSKAM